MAADSLDRLRRDYAPAFLRHLSRRDEVGLQAAYELGRRAMRQDLSMLDLTEIHHTHLLHVLKTSTTQADLDVIAQAASAFLVEALAPFEMTHRAFTEERRRAAGVQQPPRRR